MMQQYQRLKAAHPDALLFFRLGDFYELFFDDAVVGARELEITLTSRTTAGSGGERIPMCGVPHHAVDGHVRRLVERGYKVALSEQVEDPRTAKGLVRREVVRVVTPGTVLDPSALPDKANNYLVALAFGPEGRAVGLARVDFSTGEFRCAEYAGPAGRNRLWDELTGLEPAEVVVGPGAGEDPELERWLGRLAAAVGRPLRPQAFRPADAARVIGEHFGTVSLEAYGCAEQPMAAAAAGVLLTYLRENQVGNLTHIRTLRTESYGETMVLDAATRRNLELVEPLRWAGWAGTRRAPGGTGDRGGPTLLGLLDRTQTAAGGRLLRNWVLHPLVRLEPIVRRHDAVAELSERHLLRDELREVLGRVYDLERLVTRAAAGTAAARDLLALRQSLEAVPLARAGLDGAGAALLRELALALDPVDEVAALIAQAIADDPGPTLKEGGLIRSGYSEAVDRLRESARDGKEWIARLETGERARTGIKSLKVGFNRVFGYYLEVTQANLALVPEDYVRRQTLANAERFVTPELKEREAAVLGAEERLKDLEYELFCEVRDRVTEEAGRIQATAAALAALDVLLALGEVAARYGYRRPQLTPEVGITIRGGRHPVVERLQTAEEFVPNDCRLGGAETASFAVITGPNMAGKSTYCRQVALIALMAQMGSLVPADEARIGVVDRIFTRIGASDELAGGRSTFMVEMSETANILNHATDRSLIVLDEIGRGTSTYDGLSLAWAVAEYIAGRLGALTLFATHYHELTALESMRPGVANYCISVRQVGDEVVFLRKVSRGAVDRSYGIEVARLAGLPPEVITRAREVLLSLEGEGVPLLASPGAPAAPTRAAGSAGAEAAATRDRSVAAAGRQLAIFEAVPSEIERELADLDVLNLTPLQALAKLHELQERIRGRKR